jgi:hypothetical protein
MNMEHSKVNCLGKIKILAEKLFQCHIVLGQLSFPLPHSTGIPMEYRAYSMMRWSNFRSMFKQVIRNKEIL